VSFAEIDKLLKIGHADGVPPAGTRYTFAVTADPVVLHKYIAVTPRVTVVVPARMFAFVVVSGVLVIILILTSSMSRTLPYSL